MSIPRNAEYTKQYNQKLFLRLLHREPMSRADIARKIGLTRASASLIADELLKDGWLNESKLASSAKSGRPPVALSIAEDACYAIGIFLNRDGCSAGVVSFSGKVICKASFKLTQQEDKLSSLCASLEKLIEASGVKRKKIIGAGISAPGFLDAQNGRIFNSKCFNLWHNTDMTNFVSQTLNMPVYMENDASSIARFNLGKPEAHGSENYLLLLVDSAVGSGIILSGKLFHGKNFFTGELGHTSIKLDGKRCECGNRGCLEAYAAIPNILEGTRFSSWEDVMNERHISEDAKGLFEREIEYLAAGITNLANLMGIDSVLIAGDLRYDAESASEQLEKAVNERVLHHPIKVYPACSDANIKPLASAEIVFDRFLSV